MFRSNRGSFTSTAIAGSSDRDFTLAGGRFIWLIRLCDELIETPRQGMPECHQQETCISLSNRRRGGNGIRGSNVASTRLCYRKAARALRRSQVNPCVGPPWHSLLRVIRTPFAWHTAGRNVTEITAREVV